MSCIPCASPNCANCSKPVSSNGVKALNNVWHKDCFRCMTCNSDFANDNGKFLVNQGKPYCRKCGISIPSNNQVNPNPLRGNPVRRSQRGRGGRGRGDNNNGMRGNPNRGRGNPNRQSQTRPGIPGRPNSNRLSKNSCFVCQRPLTDQRVFYALQKGYHADCFKCFFCNNILEQGRFVAVNQDPACHDCAIEKLASKCKVCTKSIVGKVVTVLDYSYHPECLKCAECDIVLTNYQKIYKKNNSPVCPGCVEAVFNSKKTIIEKSKRSSLKNSDNTPKSMKEILSSLESCLEDERTLVGLLEFMRADYSVENILFYLDVSQFKTLDLPPKDLKIYTTSIWHKYFEQPSDLEINVDSSVHLQVKRSLSSPHKNMFDESLNEVLKLMRLCTFPRFANSRIAKDLLQKYP